MRALQVWHVVICRIFIDGVSQAMFWATKPGPFGCSNGLDMFMGVDDVREINGGSEMQ